MILLVTRLFLVTQVRRKSLDFLRLGRARVTLIKRRNAWKLLKLMRGLLYSLSQKDENWA
jgi:hypothetical protein